MGERFIMPGSHVTFRLLVAGFCLYQQLALCTSTSLRDHVLLREVPYSDTTAARMHAAAVKACAMPSEVAYVDCSAVLSAARHPQPLRLRTRRNICTGYLRMLTPRRETERGGLCRELPAPGVSGELRIRRVAATTEFYHEVFDLLFWLLPELDKQGRRDLMGDIYHWFTRYRIIVKGISPSHAYRLPVEQVRLLDNLQRTVLLQSLGPIDSNVSAPNLKSDLPLDLLQQTTAFSHGMRLLRTCVSSHGGNV